MVTFAVIIEKGKRNFSAYCPDLPGVIATGKTEEDTIERMRGAIEFHLEGLREEKQSLPSPTSTVRKIQVPKRLFEKTNCHRVPA